MMAGSSKSVFPKVEPSRARGLNNRKTLFLLFFCFLLTASRAWADMLPAVVDDNASSPVRAGVAMSAAQVKAHISKAKNIAGADTSRYTVEVTADFDMVGTTDLKTGKEFEAWFPVDLFKTRPIEIAPFSVEVDGKPVRAIRRRFRERTGTPLRSGPVWGYSWRLPGFKTGQKQNVSVRYSFVLRQIRGKGYFVYFLLSGARWDGPIGRETVAVRADKGLDLKVISPVALKSVESPPGTLTWKIVNAKPTEDISLEISSEVKP